MTTPTPTKQQINTMSQTALYELFSKEPVLQKIFDDVRDNPGDDNAYIAIKANIMEKTGLTEEDLDNGDEDYVNRTVDCILMRRILLNLYKL